MENFSLQDTLRQRTTTVNIRTRSELVLITITLVWGSTFVITKQGYTVISPILLIFLRFALALLYLALFTGKKGGISGKLLFQGVLLGLLLAFSYTTQSVGLKSTSVAKSAFITYTFSILTPPLQFFISRKPLKAGNLLGLVIVVIGMFIFTNPETSGFNNGDFLTMLCAVGYAFYIVYLDVFSRESDTGKLTLIQFVTVTVATGIVFPFLETPVFIPSFDLLWRLFYLGIPATFVVLYYQNRYQKFVTPTRAVIIFSLEPVFASFLAFILSGQLPLSYEITGAGLIFSGLMLSELWDRFPVRVSEE